MMTKLQNQDLPLDSSITNSTMEQILLPIENALHLPGEIYTSPDIFSREYERIFSIDWLCVGRTEEVTKPGDYITTHIMSEPVLITLDEDEKLHAFSNLCKHRGVQLVDKPCGNTSRLTCPYHGWAYNLQGQLVGTTFMDRTSDFDASSVYLNRLKIDTWDGWLFVTFNKKARPLSDFVNYLENDIGFLQMGRCRVAHKLVTTWDCNWKFVTENLSDPYHFRALHAKTIGSRIPAETYQFELRERGDTMVSYDSASQTPEGNAPLGPMPWLDKYSPGMSVFSFLAPNMVIIGRIDEIHVYCVWPEAVDRTRVVLYHLFPAEHFAQPNFNEKSKTYIDFLEQIVEEDRYVAPYLQQAALSKNFTPGRLSWLEGAVYHQLRYNVERIFK